MLREPVLIGRIVGLQIFRVPEFGTRAGFGIERAGQCTVTCSVADDVAREFIPYYHEGDIIALSGIYEPRPSTASSNTPWAGRFRVRAVRALGSAGAAA